MKIEKRYIDSFKPGVKNPPPDKTYNSLKELKEEYIERGENEDWVDSFISILENKGTATDRFAQYKIVYENGDTVTILPEIFNI